MGFAEIAIPTNFSETVHFSRNCLLASSRKFDRIILTAKTAKNEAIKDYKYEYANIHYIVIMRVRKKCLPKKVLKVVQVCSL